jgi:hypothetical protein
LFKLNVVHEVLVQDILVRPIGEVFFNYEIVTVLFSMQRIANVQNNIGSFGSDGI